MTGPFRRRCSAAPQKVLSENLSPISLSATEPSPSVWGGREDGTAGERMERMERRQQRGSLAWLSSRPRRSSALPAPGRPRVFVCPAGPGWDLGSGSAPAGPARLRRDRERRAWRARGGSGGALGAGGGRCYYSVKTKHSPRPAKRRCLARKCIFQSGRSQAFI